MTHPYNNNFWQADLGDAFNQIVIQGKGRSDLFMDAYKGTSADWMSWVAPPSDYNPDDQFFGTKTSNFLILSNPWMTDMTVHQVQTDDTFKGYRSRIQAAFPGYPLNIFGLSDCMTFVFIDKPAWEGVARLNHSMAETFDVFEARIKALCISLEDLGFVYLGTDKAILYTAIRTSATYTG